MTNDAWIQVDWPAITEMADTANAVITSYQLEWSTDDATWSTVNGGDQSIGEMYTGTTFGFDTGVVQGTLYYFRVTAWNAHGTGPVGTSATITPSAIADTPATVVVLTNNDNARFEWFPPANDRGASIIQYDLQVL